MRPDARVASAIQIVDEWLGSDTGLDRILTQWARSNRYAGSGDRAAIADLVYGAIRKLRSASWVAGETTPNSGRALLHGAALLDGKDTDALFSGARHAPDTLASNEIAARRDLAQAPRAVRFDYPDWLEQNLIDVRDEDLDALRNRAALDLRVNTLKSDPERAIKILAEDGISAYPLPGLSTALRVTDGNRKVARSRAYDQGLVEVQDAGSQQLANLANARPGELVLDLCAGGGGKTLALAASADGKAKIVAHDISAKRLSDLPARALRAGVDVEIIEPEQLVPWTGKADLVLVDAPCSGSGAWRRNPDAKWQLNIERLQSLVGIQEALLEQAVDMCNPEGRIIYGTCSILRIENQDRIDAFMTNAPEWSVINRLQSRPANGTDGFFGAVLAR